MLFLILWPVKAVPNGDIPNANLAVTVQEKHDGKIAPGLHIFELNCFNGNCSLSTVSINQCFDSHIGNAFIPKSQHSSTQYGNLNVRRQGNTLQVEEGDSDADGKYVTNLRFEYETYRGFASRLIGFSGGYVKDSRLLKRVLIGEYIPLQNEYQIIKLNCDALVPGINKK